MFSTSQRCTVQSCMISVQFDWGLKLLASALDLLAACLLNILWKSMISADSMGMVNINLKINK